MKRVEQLRPKAQRHYSSELIWPLQKFSCIRARFEVLSKRISGAAAMRAEDLYKEKTSKYVFLISR
jgi:hypothetical protein